MSNEVELARIAELRAEYFSGVSHERYVTMNEELQALLREGVHE